MTLFGLVFTKTLSILTVFGSVLVVVLLLALVLKDSKLQKKVVNFSALYGLPFAFFIAVISTVGSLTYSEIIGFKICILCWYQRIFMYPQVFILGIATYKKDLNVTSYGILLSLIGALIAFYHWLLQTLQMNGIAELPCSAVGLTPSCATVYVLEFGYVTIPMMALIAFLLIALVLNFVRISRNQQNISVN